MGVGLLPAGVGRGDRKPRTLFEAPVHSPPPHVPAYAGPHIPLETFHGRHVENGLLLPGLNRTNGIPRPGVE